MGSPHNINGCPNEFCMAHNKFEDKYLSMVTQYVLSGKGSELVQCPYCHISMLITVPSGGIVYVEEITQQQLNRLSTLQEAVQV